MQTYTSNEFLSSAGVSSSQQATGEAPSQKTSMKRRSCEVPLGDISTQNFKVSLGDLSNDQNYDCRSLRSTKSEDYRQRTYRPIDSRSVKNFRSSLIDISTYSLSRPPSYDQLSRRSIVEAPDQGITSSIEGVLWSDEEETEYFYHENIQAAWNQVNKVWTPSCNVNICGSGHSEPGTYCGKRSCNMIGCNCDGGCIPGNPLENFRRLYGHITYPEKSKYVEWYDPFGWNKHE